MVGFGWILFQCHKCPFRLRTRKGGGWWRDVNVTMEMDGNGYNPENEHGTLKSSN